MAKKSQNPFREGSLNRKIMDVLLRNKKPLPVREIAKRAKVSLGRTAQVLAALRNPFHNSAARKAGLSVEIEGDGFVIRQVEPEPNARRPLPKDGK
ncbi:MAG: hypothetical protein M5U26_11695 [Planctomycetota bacterium]|nr:hypothetical protein [Planctomycetota bacterium]